MNNNITVSNNQPGIYRILNKVNGKFYIGSTVNFRKRMREHLFYLRNGNHVNNHLQHAFNKYGEKSFSFEVVEYVDDIEKLMEIEQMYLDELKPYDMNVGYNISDIATHYRVVGEEHHAFGVPKSKEHRMKISQSLKGHKHTEETRRKISRSLEGKNCGKDHWSYGKERSEQHRKNLSKSLKGKFAGKNNPFYGKKHTLEARKKMGIPVVQLTKDGEFIAKYDSAAIAAEENGISNSHIGCCCKGKRKTTGGYKWMYLKDYESMKNKSL